MLLQDFGDDDETTSDHVFETLIYPALVHRIPAMHNAQVSN